MSKTVSSYPVRRLQIDVGLQPSRYWFKGRPFETYWFNALSLGLPTAERYAIATVKAFLPKITDEVLKSNAKAFIGQEATHSFLHDKCNLALEKQGFSFSIARYANWRLSIAHWFSPLTSVALTMTWEHMTTIICEHMLTDIESQKDDVLEHIEEPFCALWVWHCAEELEHKALAYDLYIHGNGGYIRKIAVFLWGTTMFVTDFAWLTLHNMARDKRFFDLKVWGGAFRYAFGRKGLFFFWLSRWLAFFNPKFHPNKTDHSVIIKHALARINGRYSIVGAVTPTND